MMMGLTNFLADRYGAAMVMSALQESYPPAIVLIDALGEYDLPEAIDKWADAHMIYVASQPAGPALPWDKYRHRFLTEKPALKVLLDLLKDLGLTDLAGIDVAEFIQALTAWKEGAASQGIGREL
jgi:hypothetical protein